MKSFSLLIKALMLNLILSAWVVSITQAEEDWTGFRGPGGSGASSAKNLPLKWSGSKGIKWKVALPGPGTSSPIHHKGKIYLTSYSGYGDGSRGSIGNLKLHVLCIDSKSKKIVWDKSMPAASGEQSYSGIGIPNHGYASSTPITDGETVVSFFGKSGLIAYDVNGNKLWKKNVSERPGTDRFGSGASLVKYKNLVIVPASVECESIIAYDIKSGDEKWRSPAEGYGAWWCTPIVSTFKGNDELIASVPGEVWALNPSNGKLRWYADSFSDRATCPSPVVNDGVVYIIGGRGGNAIAIKQGGRKNVTESNVVWKIRDGSYVTSPVYHDRHLYWVSDRGIANCVKAKTGESVYQERLSGARSVYASALLADGKIYVVSRFNGTFVLEAKPEFKQLAHNEISSDESDFNASPVVLGEGLLLRSDKYLYYIGR